MSDEVHAPQFLSPCLNESDDFCNMGAIYSLAACLFSNTMTVIQAFFPEEDFSTYRKFHTKISPGPRLRLQVIISCCGVIFLLNSSV